MIYVPSNLNHEPFDSRTDIHELDQKNDLETLLKIQQRIVTEVETQLPGMTSVKERMTQLLKKIEQDQNIPSPKVSDNTFLTLSAKYPLTPSPNKPQHNYDLNAAEIYLFLEGVLALGEQYPQNKEEIFQPIYSTISNLYDVQGAYMRVARSTLCHMTTLSLFSGLNEIETPIYRTMFTLMQYADQLVGPKYAKDNEEPLFQSGDGVAICGMFNKK